MTTNDSDACPDRNTDPEKYSNGESGSRGSEFSDIPFLDKIEIFGNITNYWGPVKVSL